METKRDFKRYVFYMKCVVYTLLPGIGLYLIFIVAWSNGLSETYFDYRNSQDLYSWESESNAQLLMEEERRKLEKDLAMLPLRAEMEFLREQLKLKESELMDRYQQSLRRELALMPIRNKLEMLQKQARLKELEMDMKVENR